MNIHTIARQFNAARDRRQNKATIPLRPDPEYRARRLAQMTTERQERYWRNVGSI